MQYLQQSFAQTIKQSLGAGLFGSREDNGNIDVLQKRLASTLTVTAALCFIGHGSWGVITKAGWLPFFTSMGIPESWAWHLMPIIGTIDITLAILLVITGYRALMMWMCAWCVWTALLRPLSGASMWEVWERGGNFGPPLVLLVVGGAYLLRPKDLLKPMQLAPLTNERVQTVEILLRGFLFLLLLGHAAFGVFVQKEMFGAHYASIGLPGSKSFIVGVGVFEVFLASLVLLKTKFWRTTLWCILAWKLTTEFLYVTSGPLANIFEWIERWGDYGIPIALLYIDQYRSSLNPAVQTEPSKVMATAQSRAF
ncbi:MAG: hypothetical protein AB7T49_19535 [Oligoflexales bacterium]